MLRLDHSLSSRPQQARQHAELCAWCRRAPPSPHWRLPAASAAVSLNQDQLLAWAKRRGVNVEKLIARPAADDNGDLYLRAGRSCPKGETVWSIPKEVGTSGKD